MITMCSVSIDVKDVEDCPQTFPDLEQRLQVYCAYLLTPEVHHITLNTPRYQWQSNAKRGEVEYLREDNDLNIVISLLLKEK